MEMAFEGWLRYEGPLAAEHAVVAFGRYERAKECVVFPRDLIVLDDTVSLEVEAIAPMSFWNATCDALVALAQPAHEGGVEARIAADGKPEWGYRVRILPGGARRGWCPA